MPARRAPPLALRDGDLERLAGWMRSSSIRAGLAQRARIVMLAAGGVSNTSGSRRDARCGAEFAAAGPTPGGVERTQPGEAC